MQISGIAAVVTGAASGLGAATCRLLAAEGAMVFGIDLPDAVDAAAADSEVRLLAADVTDAADVERAMETVSRQGVPLRAIVNCAGIGPTQRVLGREGVKDTGFFGRVVSVNLVGTFNVLAYGAAAIARTDPIDEDGLRGAIVNTASIAAFEGQVGQTAYAASKAGVVGLTLPAARDLARSGIRVNTIAPGIVETPMLQTVAPEFRQALSASVPFPSRLGRPDEYASLALTLLTNDYINGETVRMDGSLRMAPQ